MAEKLTAKDALVNTSLVCTDAKLGMLDTLINSSLYSIGMADKVCMEDVFMVGQSDKLVRLRRNTVALKMLLEQAKDAALLIKMEIADILNAFDQADRERERVHREALLREQERQRERAKYKAKKMKAQSALD